jgi:hypothetical protein
VASTKLLAAPISFSFRQARECESRLTRPLWWVCRAFHWFVRLCPWYLRRQVWVTPDVQSTPRQSLCELKVSVCLCWKAEKWRVVSRSQSVQQQMTLDLGSMYCTVHMAVVEYHYSTLWHHAVLQPTCCLEARIRRCQGAEIDGGAPGATYRARPRGMGGRHNGTLDTD